MQKFANFVVNKRYYILTVMLLLFVVCAFLAPGVEINRDMTVYLPDNSEVKKGFDVLEDEFADIMPAGSIRVMFKDLPDERVPEVRKQLADMEYATSVNYSDSEAYNKDGYRLFVVNCDYKYNTDEEQALEKSIADTFGQDHMVFQHTEAIISTIPPVVYIVAVLVLLVILFIMCSSYVEPFLFLATIGIAIVMNMGTNIFFGRVSETTYTISAILQLVLSMDYSIILMNRYRQGKEHAETPAVAMKNAFRAAFPSIVSSGMTTVIGLIMLVFMRFKIGLDLGRSLAKGVALSMICVLTILPALILISDKWIVKTRKKTPHIPTKFAAHYGYRARRVLAVVFAVLFISMIFLQGLTTTTFAQPKDRTIDNVFPLDNQLVVLYPKEQGDQVAAMIPTIEGMDSVKLVLSYENTVGKKVSAEELTQMLGALSPDMAGKLNPTLLRTIYYLYYRGDTVETDTMTMEELLNFLSDQVAKDESLSGFIDEDMKNTLIGMGDMADRAFLTKPMTAAELAAALGQKEEQMILLMGVVRSADPQYTPPAMTVAEFVAAVEQMVQNPALSGQIPPEVGEMLASLHPFLDETFINTSRTAVEMAEALQYDAEMIRMVYHFKFGNEDATGTMTMPEFVDFILNDLAKRPALGHMLPADKVAQLKLAQTVLQATLDHQTFTADELARLFGIPAGQVRLIYTIKDTQEHPDAVKLSVAELLNHPAVGALLPNLGLDEAAVQAFQASGRLVQAIVDETLLTSADAYGLLSGLVPEGKVTANQVTLLYLLHFSMTDYDPAWTMTPETCVGFLADHVVKDPLFDGLLDDGLKLQIAAGAAMVREAANGLRGDEHAILLINTSLPEESELTSDTVHGLQDLLAERLTGDYHLVGYSVMNVEMEDNFQGDLLLITLLTALAIFVVVALTFRSVGIPLILVLLVQCGVYITVAFSGLIGHDMYYLSMLIVQCILMGATIDYGIVFTNYYIDNRKKYGVREALEAAFSESIHTILTSGLIIILITGIIGFSPADPAITEICQTLSVGTISAVLLILFILPGLLAAFDRSVMKSKRAKKSLPSGETDPADDDGMIAPTVGSSNGMADDGDPIAPAEPSHEASGTTETAESAKPADDEAKPTDESHS